MKNARLLVAGLAMFAAATVPARGARAQGGPTYPFTFSGPGVAGSLVLTFGAAVDAKYPDAYELTRISGTFTDTNNGLNIVDASVGALVPVNYATPEPDNLLAPHDFSRFAVASGLPAQSNGYVTYDNLFWPAGSPQTGSDYPPHGGFLDVYGLLFDIGGGRVVNFWSNGVTGPGIDIYGISVSTANTALDYVGGGVTAGPGTQVLPEPESVWLLGVGGAGLVGVLARRRRVTPAV